MNASADTHPSDETLSRFVDNTLTASARREVTAHLAQCSECSDVVLTARSRRTEAPPSEPPIRRLDSIRWLPAAAIMAAAAVLVVLFLSPVRERFLPPRGIEKLVRASEPLAYRRIDARLTGGFPYRPYAESLPHGVNLDDRSLRHVAGEIQNAAPRTAESLHALGVSHLLLQHADGAVRSLVLALGRVGDDADQRNEITIDLAAAMIARGSTEDLEAALKHAESAWNATRAPEAAWNRAVAAETLGRRDLAARAWDDYLRVDPDSPWAAEARKRRRSQ